MRVVHTCAVRVPWPAILAGLLLAPAFEQVGRSQDLSALESRYEQSYDSGDYRTAAAVAESGLRAAERFAQTQPGEVSRWANMAGSSYRQLGEYAKAEPLLKRALEIDERLHGPVHEHVAQDINNLASLYFVQGEYTRAREMYLRALSIHERLSGPNGEKVALVLNNLGMVHDSLGDPNKALETYDRALRLWKQIRGPRHRDVASTLGNVGTAYLSLGRLQEAEKAYRESLNIRWEQLGPEHPDVAENLMNLGLVYAHKRQYQGAEEYLGRAIRIWDKALGAQHPQIINALNSLATFYIEQGHYAKAAPILQRALSMAESTLGREHPYVALLLINLGNACSEQGRASEAIRYHDRGLKILSSALGEKHPELAVARSNLANTYAQIGKLDEAARLHRESLAVLKEAYGDRHPSVLGTLINLSAVLLRQQKSEDAEELIGQALAVSDAAPETRAEVSAALNNLVIVGLLNDDVERAAPWVEKLIEYQREGDLPATTRAHAHYLHAIILWKQDKRDAALAQLGVSLDFAERQRGSSSGTGADVGKAFARFGGAFEQMIDWQTELGNIPVVFQTMEGSRARSMFDELDRHGIDLLSGLPAAERARLREAAEGAGQEVQRLTNRLVGLQTSDGAPAGNAAEAERVRTQLRAARERAVDAQRAIETASRTARLSGAGAETVTLELRRQRLAEAGAIQLQYFLGVEGGYVLVLPGDGDAKVFRLTIEEEQARELGVDAGPATLERLSAALTNGKSGAVDLLSRPGSAMQSVPKLFALWHVLVPAENREALLSGTYSRLIIIPDGPLALLPFEALVTGDDPSPAYLLDAGLPIQYAASSSVAERLRGSGASNTAGLLTVGDPDYARGTGSAGRTETVGAQARYAVSGGRLLQLPHARTESTWVRQVFEKNGVQVEQLVGTAATEKAILTAAPGKRYLHFACHALLDDDFENSFGALAVSPGADATSGSQDGFLTLMEIYGLPLEGCELAVLSACETNFGPQQAGEGVWALSRGFLVAGARRVLASNWLVDDEAAASLVSYYMSAIAQAEKAGDSPEYAKSLARAKRWVRQQEQWSSPYYWATFSLVGAE